MTYATPYDVTIDGNPAENFPVRTNAASDARPVIRAQMDPNSSESGSRRMEVDWSIDPNFGSFTTSIDLDGFKPKNQANNGRVEIPTDPQYDGGMVLQPDTEYFYRIYARRNNGTIGSAYRTGSFITPHVPNAPVPSSPGNEAEIPISVPSLTFSWDYNHPESGEQKGTYFRWRTAGTPTTPEGPWTYYIGGPIDTTSGIQYRTWQTANCLPPDARWELPFDAFGVQCYDLHPGEYHELESFQPINTFTTVPSLFPQNQRIEWQTLNFGNPWPEDYYRAELHVSEPSVSFYFTITGPTTAPNPLLPNNEQAVVWTSATTFSWNFRDPVEGTEQTSALIRYREIGTTDWTTVDLGLAYDDESYTFAANTFEPSTHYEWQVGTINDRGEASPWSISARFWSVVTPGGGNPEPVIGEPLGALGCGTHRAFIYDRKGEVRRGEVTHLTRVKWDRRRDDISEASILVSDWDDDCGELLKTVRSWIHELVIFREHPSGLLLERVWEGPVTRVTYRSDQVEIAAHDCMAYVYRRILRQGFNDAYRIIGGVQVGLKTVVFRSRSIILNCLAYDDPNLLPYLTAMEYDDDARTSRVVPEYSSNAWEQVDDLAATAGLDYTTVGRRIILNDTHRPVGVLPEMRDGDFGDDPVVTEYGMQLANYYAVTNNAGVWGAADRFVDGDPQFYGHIEMIASAYGEAEGAAQSEVLTPAALAALRTTLAEQAERNISGRYPTPLVVRVPDNTTLNPEVEIGINQLVPGVWIPLRSVNTLRPITQMQKLDLLTVTEEKGVETITVTISPAPNSNDDAEPTPEV